MTRIKSKLIASLIAIAMVLALVFTSLPAFTSAQAVGSSDSDVSNSASFSTDTIYQIVTDRFFDGDPSNNPSGDIFDKNNPRKYHGGDWAGITDKIDNGYLTNM